MVITIHGTNDAAVISGAFTGSVTEAGGVANADAGQPTATGTLTDTDVDNAANTFQPVLTATASDSHLGTYTVDASGHWTYTLDNSNTTVQGLNANQSTTDTFKVLTADGTSQTVTVTITGTNDAAVISGTSIGSVTEAGGVANASPGQPTATGALTDTDVDNAANSFQPVSVAAASDSQLGTYTVDASGYWNYTLDNTNAAVQALNASQTTTDTFKVLTTDGTSQTVTITIHGTDDAPVANNDTITNVSEDTPVTIATSVLLANDTDVDNANLTVTSVGIAGHSLHGGTVSLVNNIITYTPAANFNGADSFTYTVSDGTLTSTATASFNVAAVNDAPVVSYNPTDLTFNGTNYATGPVATTHLGNGPSDGVTIEGWVDFNGQANSGNHPQVLFYNGNTSFSGFGVMGVKTADGHLDLDILAGGSNGYDTGIKLNAGEWHNVAVTHVNGVFTLYVDGVADYTTAGGAGAIPHAPDAMLIGGDGGENFEGSIGDVSVWNAALTPAQIQANEFTVLSGSETNLAAYYPLNDGSGSTVKDAVNPAGNLTMVGTPSWQTTSSWPATTVATTEDHAVTITGIAVSDIDAGAASIDVKLAVGHGTVTLANIAGLTVTGNGTGLVDLVGSQAAIDTALANGVTYTPASNFNGLGCADGYRQRPGQHRRRRRADHDPADRADSRRGQRRAGRCCAGHALRRDRGIRSQPAEHRAFGQRCRRRPRRRDRDLVGQPGHPQRRCRRQRGHRRQQRHRHGDAHWHHRANQRAARHQHRPCHLQRQCRDTRAPRPR